MWTTYEFTNHLNVNDSTIYRCKFLVIHTRDLKTQNYDDKNQKSFDYFHFQPNERILNHKVSWTNRDFSANILKYHQVTEQELFGENDILIWLNNTTFSQTNDLSRIENPFGWFRNNWIKLPYLVFVLCVSTSPHNKYLLQGKYNTNKLRKKNK